MTVDLAVTAELWRGGTSRGLVLDASCVRSHESELLAAALGSPDPLGRQVDGLGGGASSLSKVALVAPSADDDHDVDFTFAQVDVTTAQVEFAGTCGNFMSAVGPYAVGRGWLDVEGPSASIRIRCVNTGATVVATIECQAGDFRPAGDLVIDGVPGSGSPIRLDWPSAASRVEQFPLGEGVVLEEAAIRYVVVGNPLVIVDGGSLGFPTPEDFDAGAGAVLPLLDGIRRQIAVRAGLAGVPEDVAQAVPKIAVTWDGPHRCAVATRVLSMGAVHRTVPLSAAMALAGDQAIRAGLAEVTVEVRHREGKVAVGVSLDGDGADRRIGSVTTYRTARRLMRGEVFVPAARLRP